MQLKAVVIICKFTYTGEIRHLLHMPVLGYFTYSSSSFLKT